MNHSTFHVLLYVFIAENKIAAAMNSTERAIQKGCPYEKIINDLELTKLHALPEWNALMKKHFPDQFKDK